MALAAAAASKRGSRVTLAAATLAAAAALSATAVAPRQAAAAPFMNVSLVGRVQGSGAPFASNVTVAAGDIVEYQVQLQLATEGTTNTPANRTITDWVPSNGSTSPTSGLNAIRFSLSQAADAGVQVDFDAGTTGTTTGGGTWGSALGSSAGTLTARGGTGNEDLINVGLLREIGNFDGIGASDVPELLTVASGVFDVASASSSAVLNVGANGVPAGTLASYRWLSSTGANVNYGQTVANQTASVTAGDPIITYTPLTLAVPEPATAATLALAAGCGLLGRRRRRPA